MNQEWDIQPRAPICRTCGRAYVGRDTVVSILRHGAEGYQREDFCQNCWTATEHAAALSFWRSRFVPPSPPPEEALKKETAETLLRQLMDKDDPSLRNTIFILAVMLERRRILVERDVRTREDGLLLRLYEHRHTGETFLIPDPKLRLGELAAVQQEVIARLGGSEEPASDEPSSPAVSETNDEGTR